MRKRAIILLVAIIGALGKTKAQKGEKSIAAGLVVAFPVNRVIYSDDRSFNSGVGLEAIGQYNFTEKSAALLQLQLTRFTGEAFYGGGYRSTSFISSSLKGGYRCKFNTKGLYGNALIGVESSSDGSSYIAAALGLGKRFPIKDVYFIDAGLDYIVGNINRFNIKAVFSLLRRPKVELTELK